MGENKSLCLRTEKKRDQGPLKTPPNCPTLNTENDGASTGKRIHGLRMDAAPVENCAGYLLEERPCFHLDQIWDETRPIPIVDSSICPS